MSCICNFYALPRASYGYIWFGFMPNALWRISIFQLFRCRNLASTRDILVHLVGSHVGGCQAYWYVCLCGGTIHPPIQLYTPTCLFTPHVSIASCTSVCPPIHQYVSICHGDFGASVHSYTCQTFLYLSVHPFASQFITVIPVALHNCGSLLCWTGCLWMYAQLHAVDLFFSL